MTQPNDTFSADGAEQSEKARKFVEALGPDVSDAIRQVGERMIEAVERSIGEGFKRNGAGKPPEPPPGGTNPNPDGTNPNPKDTRTDTKTDTKPEETSNALRDAIPMLIATVGAGLLGAAAEKGSLLRYAGSVPGAIDLVAKINDKRDAKELAVPFITSALGAAGPMLIK